MSMFPIIAGHRGFKAQYPENTIQGFEKCFASGAESFETDLYLTTDEVLVVCHDANTKRTYQYENGDEADFIICKSSYEKDLKDLVNIKTGDKLLTFKHLLTWFTNYDLEKNDSKVIMLDVKGTNLKKITKYIVSEALSVKEDMNYWLKRLQFGYWDIEFVKYINQNEYFQELYNKYNITEKFQIYHITGNWKLSMAYIGYNHYLDTTYGKERKLFKFTGVSLLYLATWSTDYLEKFIPFARAEGLSIYNWTINTIFQYEYFVKVSKNAGIEHYGLISDDPSVMQAHKDKSHELKGEVVVTFSQQLSNWLFSQFLRLLPLRQPDYKSIVNGDELAMKKPPSKIGMFIFQICQRLGIF